MPRYRPYDERERARYDMDLAVKRDMRDLVRLIRDQIAERRVTYKELAEICEVHPNTMTRRMRNVGEFSEEQISRIKCRLGIRTTYSVSDI